MVLKSPTGKITTTPKEVEELMMPPDGVKQNLNGAVGSVSPDKGCEVFAVVFCVITFACRRSRYKAEESYVFRVLS